MRGVEWCYDVVKVDVWDGSLNVSSQVKLTQHISIEPIGNYLPSSWVSPKSDIDSCSIHYIRVERNWPSPGLGFSAVFSCSKSGIHRRKVNDNDWWCIFKRHEHLAVICRSLWPCQYFEHVNDTMLAFLYYSKFTKRIPILVVIILIINCN